MYQFVPAKTNLLAGWSWQLAVTSVQGIDGTSAGCWAGIINPTGHQRSYTLHMCMYSCIHILTLINIDRKRIYIYMYACMHACMYVCMYVSMYVCMYVCMHACMYVCMHACMHACMHVCMYMYLNIYIYIYTHLHMYIHFLVILCRLYIDVGKIEHGCMVKCKWLCPVRFHRPLPPSGVCGRYAPLFS